ncbi:acid protease [Aureobasidium pullulans]|uniref:Acid protease n=1 Tax=Aureobasidium pullulans TaxID=5580 RepID=A0A4V4IQA0_AURPU|nr:acid protease [Aureobasidium pullulans]THY31856.1 acid protease [Aureobasidium pullulans]
MKFTGSIPLVFLCASSALAKGTLEFSLKGERHSQLLTLAERDVNGTSESALLTNFAGQLGTRYFVNFTVGTPGQLQTALLDTGSSDTILLASDASICAKKSSCPGGSYNSSASSTFSLLSAGAIEAQYGASVVSGTMTGDLVTDVIQVGDIAVTGAHFGIAHEAQGRFLGNGAFVGIMGLAYSAPEALREGQPLYPTFVESLVGAGAIASRLFSLYLNEVSSFGSILFGGIDTKKYEGNLTTLNFLQVSAEEKPISAFWMHLDEVSMTRDDGTKEQIVEPDEIQQPVLPDSGSAYWDVPTDVYNKIINATGARISQNNALLACSKISNGTYFAFTFSGNGTNKVNLEVPLSSFFTPAVLADGSGLAKIGGEDACLLMAQNAGSDAKFYLVGDPVIRAGYWVYDLDNGQVSIAKARLSATASNIVAVEAGSHGLMIATDQYSELAANQTERVAGTATASVSYSLSTASEAVGQTAGPQSTDLSSAAGSSVLGVTTDGIVSLAGALLISVAFGAFLL